MQRRFAWTALAVAWWFVSCRDIPAPENGVHSLSPLVLPAPGLVAGDTLRDTLGLVAPLNVIAYDRDLRPLDPQPDRSFVVIDTGALIAMGRYLVGVTPGTTVRVVGSVGGLQTVPVPVKVTLSPDTLVAADDTLRTRNYALTAGDTAVNADLGVRVEHRATPPTGVEAVIVRYSIVKSPPPRAGATGPTVVLLNGNTRSERDTTDNSGRASRTARLRIAAHAGAKTDTAIVRATASYRGESIGAVQFTIIFQNTDP